MQQNFNNLKNNIKDSIRKVSKNDNRPDFEKEDLILKKLESKLGKPKNEIKNMLSEGLMKILTKVPFTV